MTVSTRVSSGYGSAARGAAEPVPVDAVPSMVLRPAGRRATVDRSRPLDLCPPSGIDPSRLGHPVSRVYLGTGIVGAVLHRLDGAARPEKGQSAKAHISAPSAPGG